MVPPGPSNKDRRNMATRDLANLRRTIKSIIEFLPRDVDPKVIESLKRIDMDVQTLDKKLNLHVGDLPQGVGKATRNAYRNASDVHERLITEKVKDPRRAIELVRKKVLDVHAVVERL